MESDKAQRIYKFIMAIVITAAVTFIVTTIGVYKAMQSNTLVYVKSDSSDIGKRIEYYKNFIDKYYIYDVDEEKMNDYAIKGYFAGLGDEYCEYITKEEMEDYLADATGKYVGIGVYIAADKEANKILVLGTIKDSPAEEAGIKAGDYIVKVDGIEYNASQLSEASAKLKSEEGIKTKVEILRENNTLEFEIERRTIVKHHINNKVLDNSIGYIRIDSFDEGSYDEFIQNYNELKEKNIKSLIIDLRNNGGGIVEEATNIADLFIEKEKTILITKSKGKEEQLTTSEKDKQIDIPVVILVNGRTASASEILTVSVKENNKDTVTIVGTKTYGKGVIQSIFTLKDKSGVKLTTEEYFSPNHNSINKVGITPDVEVELPKDSNIVVSEDKDTQLKKAIELLK